PLDFYQRGCSLDEHREDIALLELQIAEITSFVQTTQLLQRQNIGSLTEGSKELVCGKYCLR
ncbi:MAG: hypothetical protein CL915_14450, partial [Deltaproteobacteria bacterium]|nr:hypothetical protein [Deltaproteobacteria bacterium]